MSRYCCGSGYNAIATSSRSRDLSPIDRLCPSGLDMGSCTFTFLANIGGHISSAEGVLPFGLAYLYQIFQTENYTDTELVGNRLASLDLYIPVQVRLVVCWPRADSARHGSILLAPELCQSSTHGWELGSTFYSGLLLKLRSDLSPHPAQTSTGTSKEGCRSVTTRTPASSAPTPAEAWRRWSSPRSEKGSESTDSPNMCLVTGDRIYILRR